MYGEPVANADPIEVMADEIRWSAGHVAWLRQLVRAVDPEDDQASALIALYGRERDRLTSMCALAIRAGLSERLVALEAKRGELLATLISDLLDDPQVALSDSQRTHLRREAGRRLVLLAGRK